MKNKIFFIIAFFLLINLSGIVIAEQQGWGIFKTNDCVRLIQTCSNCTYTNISSIISPNGTIIESDLIMSTVNSIEYNYTFCASNESGDYTVNGYSNPDGIRTVWANDFKITLNGNPEPEGITIVFFSIIYVILLCLYVGVLMYTVFHFVMMDFDAKDLILNVCLYLSTFALYILGSNFFGNEFFDTMMLWMISVGSITTMIVPISAFIVSYFKGGIDKFNKSKQTPA